MTNIKPVEFFMQSQLLSARYEAATSQPECTKRRFTSGTGYYEFWMVTQKGVHNDVVMTAWREKVIELNRLFDSATKKEKVKCKK